MLQTSLIKEFLESKSIAVVGVSRKKDIPANAIFKKMADSGYDTYAINPNTADIDGIPCFPSISDLPEKPDSVFLAGPPHVSEIVVKECVVLGIKKVWMHKGIGDGSYSKTAQDYCRENGIEAIINGCPMMFIKPIDPFHRILRWFK